MLPRELTGRERTLVTAAAVIFFSMILLPTGRILGREYRETQAALSQVSSNLEQARELRRTILEQRKGRELIAQRVRKGGEQFSLFDHASSAIAKEGLKERTVIETPLASAGLETVKLTLRGVSLEELIALLHTLQHGDQLVAVERLDYIRAASDKRGLECALTVQSPRL